MKYTDGSSGTSWFKFLIWDWRIRFYIVSPIQIDRCRNKKYRKAK